MNRLSSESSPYLLQHAHNPVDWYPWGEEALQKALEEDKPILISIGYAACHWCHVMERESFENEAVATFMNRHFVNIKIDREERPDLDHIYMDALQAMTGSGGWPLNLFLTPDTRPFYGGTYFPPVKAYGRLSWGDTLQEVVRAFNERREEVEAQANQLTEHLVVANSFALPNQHPSSTIKDLFDAGKTSLVTRDQLNTVLSGLMQQADLEWGGFGRPPKFPQTFSLQWLLKYAHFTGESKGKIHALHSLDHILRGGIYDQLGGGMARYSTDGKWLAPHFEKMLYDNALLVSVLSEAYGSTKESRFRDGIADILDFVTREWQSPEGGFYSAWDADSEGEEGKFYTWTKEEIDSLLGDDSPLFCEVYGVSEEGNWEGVNILHRPYPWMDIPVAQIPILDKCRAVLLEARSMRIKPLLDDKQLLGWNALMNKAFSQAFAVTGEEKYREMAVKHMQFLLKAFRFEPESRSRSGTQAGLGHVYKGGVVRHPAFLDDYAYLIQALLLLQEITADPFYLLEAESWTRYVMAHFSDPSSGFFYYTHAGQKDILLRKKEVYDGATPSGNAVMASNLWYLAICMDQPGWKERAMSMLHHMLPNMTRYPTSFGIWADLALQAHFGWNEIAIVGEGYRTILTTVLAEYIPNKVLQGGKMGNARFPMLAGKGEKQTTFLYLCRNYVCRVPVTDATSLVQQIRGITQ